MSMVLESNKTKIAKRVIEVFEFFDNNKRQATVMDIVRCYGRPQSSTSELLASLVEMGLLYKDQRSRTYRPTPRLATLGASVQPDIIRDGRLFTFMDRIAQSTRHSVGLFGIVGTHVQLFRWSPGTMPLAGELGSGASDRLCASTAGQLLLSTMPSDESGKILRRLNAESMEEDKFNYSAMVAQIAAFQRAGHATGDAGFGCNGRVTAVLVPTVVTDRPLALGVIYPAASSMDPDALVATLRSGIAQCAGQADDGHYSAPALMRAV
ncbi:helix-turn-helix domain-containing protein [Sphingobium tyrosinilyticum]|uniref:Helix-turn-helix domain-containing protein n=1 Tax=Sphingobium tyrosinilyticum TaxID=2715436 RepID=A0ABV9F1K9_9SPHN